MNKKKSIDGNTAAAHIAYAFSEVAAIYPITPSTNMGESIDAWAEEGRKNLFGQIVDVIEMQSEAGAAGAVHGILSGGAFSSTFTASQGLLLMIPNMYKIAGELLPTVFHVSARAIAGQALSIFGDHQDVMATRQTGFCHLSSNSVQEAMDLALIAHLASLRTSLPFLHFFDGFRTSHEVQKVEMISYEDILPLVDKEAIARHRKRALNPNHPYLKGSAQNPDIYFQEMEALNPYYLEVPKIVEEEMNKVEKLTGRSYHLFDYVGDKEAQRVIIMMGSGCETAEETIRYLQDQGEKVGLIKVRLYRPFSKKHLLEALPQTVEKIAVLDRTKEAGANGEPLYLDVSSALKEEGKNIQVVGGRYGLGSKEFTPSMVKTVFENLKKEELKNHFTIGICDDVTFSSLPITERIHTEPKDRVKCQFWGLGGDGTVGANKEAIKIIGDHTDKYVQGYFSYDSKKSLGLTVSHLRFGDEPILSTYLVEMADYIACHNPAYVHKYDMLSSLKKGGTFVLNSPWDLEDMERHLPGAFKKAIAEKEIEFYNINAVAIAKEVGLGRRINMPCQTVFFKLADIIPLEKAVALLKEAIENTYGKKGEKIVEMNRKAVDLALKRLEKIEYPKSWKEIPIEKEKEDLSRPDFIRNVADIMEAQKGDTLPVSAFTPGGIFPLETAKYEKRKVAFTVPKWKPENCIQCTQCSFVCPHAVIRPFLLTEEEAKKSPDGYRGIDAFGKGVEGLKFSIQIDPADCTGCGNCVEVCPGKGGKKALEVDGSPQECEEEQKLWEYMMSLPFRSGNFPKFTLKGSQHRKPLFEFSGACAGCGETPYVKLLTQLYGERMIIANATGCSSIWGGSAPSVPWAYGEKGKGPAWANSLFEDNAEYGLGISLAVFHQRDHLSKLMEKVLDESSTDQEVKELIKKWLEVKNKGEESEKIGNQLIEKLHKEKEAILSSSNQESSSLWQEILEKEDWIVKPSVWMIGGDGWAYDIGYGGLDHVLAMDKDVNILVLDTEVYSNTGGQSSKATPLGSIAKFAAAGKRTQKKELGLLAMTYGHVYVASVSMGADKMQLLKAFKEAEEYPGPSLIIAYSSCISHGIEGGMRNSQEAEKVACESGYWLNYRFDPRRKEEKKNPFILDAKEPTKDVEAFLKTQVRYNYLLKTHPEEAKRLHQELKAHIDQRYKKFKKMSEENGE